MTLIFWHYLVVYADEYNSLYKSKGILRVLKKDWK